MKGKISRYLSIFLKKSPFFSVLILISYLLKDVIIPPESVEQTQYKLDVKLRLDLNS